MRLIDADALILKLKDAIEVGHRVDMPTNELEAVLDDVESMPTIEPKERAIVNIKIPDEKLQEAAEIAMKGIIAAQPQPTGFCVVRGCRKITKP